MAQTEGLNHLGLTVLDLQKSTHFFVNVLGWKEAGYDPTYPRTMVSDGKLKLTLWQVDKKLEVETFDRRKNVGLHHVAIQVATEQKLHELHANIRALDDCVIEFAPEPLAGGPRKHMMIREPSGLRIELIWPGE